MITLYYHVSMIITVSSDIQLYRMVVDLYTWKKSLKIYIKVVIRIRISMAKRKRTNHDLQSIHIKQTIE